MTAEDEVRAAWKDTILWGLYLYESKRSYHLQLGGWEYKGNVKDKDAVWQAALAFTRQRQQEIAEIEEEIKLVNANWSWANETSSTAEVIWQRILTRLQAQLTELKKGMK